MYVSCPFAEMREAPSRDAKVCSQTIFSEEVQLLDLSGSWALIKTLDNYTGWTLKKALVECKAYSKDIEISRLSAAVYERKDVEYGPLMILPFGAKLQLVDASDPRWNEVCLPSGKRAFVQKGDVLGKPFDLATFGNQFLGVPYLWGGRTSFGFDCSGFIQMVYGRLGIELARDAKEQILDYRANVVEDGPCVLGDLIFWGKSESEIQHVGMFLEKEYFIHTSSRENMPYLRLSKLTDLEWSAGKGVAYPFRTFRRFDIASRPLLQLPHDLPLVL
ncbi:MAG: hypothetical protein COT85_03400 [Chlamydiae bacterium CG10_big_fil_rev_8_21_14_0_10_42_34]|nr:MAG: hypothetical protein COT85_03400 [Chlamydiae bacterium CG10_big_fil_rev_8_21_14_0_10_42_34]